MVMRDTCGDAFTYLINGAESIFVGYGDHHVPEYSHLEEMSPFAPWESNLTFSDKHEHCEYDMHIFPTWDLESDYRTNHPIQYTFLVLAVFVGTTSVFVLYDYLVTRRQRKVMLAAKKSNAVVASLFPKKVREQLLANAEAQILENEKNGHKGILRLGAVPKCELKNFLTEGLEKADNVAFDTKPIAGKFCHMKFCVFRYLCLVIGLAHHYAHCLIYILPRLVPSHDDQ